MGEHKPPHWHKGIVAGKKAMPLDRSVLHSILHFHTQKWSRVKAFVQWLGARQLLTTTLVEERKTTDQRDATRHDMTSCHKT